MIQYLQLKQHFDAIAMQEEVHRLTNGWWKEHYNKKHYEGGWSIIPLRSAGGDPDNIYSLHNSGNETVRYQDTPLLQNCPYIKTVLDFFTCEKTAVRLMKLNAGAVIKEHTDHEMSFEEGEARFHIPVQTNKLVDFFILDEKIPMQEGQCWYLNLSLKHRVSNTGSEDRIHLVIDCLVNDWIKALFQNETSIKKEIDTTVTVPSFSSEDKLRIIQQLRLLNTAISNELADKMEQDIIPAGQ
jgi:mannose-6-phosphate isomerase-like protein (cupin superfamily)